MGSSNNYGQLGLNKTTSIYKPTFIETLKNEKIIRVQCGLAHVVA